MKCTRCYEEIPQGVSFCTKCGAPVQIQPQYQQQVTSQQQMMNPQQQYQQTYQQNYGGSQTVYTPITGGEQKKKSAKAAIIGVFATLSIILIVLVVMLVGRFTSDDDNDGNNGNGGNQSSTQPADDETTGNGSGDNGNGGTAVDPSDELEGTRTVMIYMIGSDLERKYGAGTLDISEMMEADYDENLRVVIQTGGSLEWKTEYIKDGEVQRFEVRDNKFYELESLGKVNMSKADTLTDFIEYAEKEFPAEKYTLVLWDHGGSIPISFGYDEVYKTGLITEADLGGALEEAGVKFESIIMDACNMCTLEVAMAVRDYGEYLVAAESTVIGTGLYYTGWLSYLGENMDADPTDYCELMVKEYMETAEQQKTDASMSYIDLSKVEDVYEAYINYMSGVYDDILSGGYEEYALARESCGLYKGTESVDLITLAKKYKTDESTELISAVNRAVMYTESDYVYGKGLAAYSPSERGDRYESARDSLEDLSYGDGVLKCFDAVVSLQLAYKGTEYVDEYAGTWYDDEIVRYYTAEGAGGKEYRIETQKIGDTNVIMLDKEDWDILSSIEVLLWIYMDDDNALVLGQEYYYENVIDDDGNVILQAPEYWTYIAGNIVSYICVDSYEDPSTGEWMQMGTVFAKVNGEEVLLILQYDNTCPDGEVIGYIPYDFETQQSPDGRARVMTFNADDEIELIHPMLEISTQTVSYYNLVGETYNISDLVLAYEPVRYGDNKVGCQYQITDIYDNKYKTDEFEY